MIPSKWNYVACGVSVVITFIGAIHHAADLVFMGFFFSVWNWYAAESKRRQEELIIFTDKEQESNNGTEEPPASPEDEE